MILQSLVKHYESLVADGKVSAQGWAPAKVSYGLCLAHDGTLEQIVCLKNEEQCGKKMVEVQQVMHLPAPVVRTGNILPNFLWDNSAYMLGIDNKGKPARAVKCFEAFAAYQHQMLDGLNDPAAAAVLAFLDSWDPHTASNHPLVAADLDGIISGSNLVFLVDGLYVHENVQIQNLWNNSCTASGGTEGVCLVTGERTSVGQLHAKIKNVAGAQSSGAVLVSFNEDAASSYGHEKGMIAPIGDYAMFAYTTALNYLLNDRSHVSRVGDTTVVYWAANGSTLAQDVMSSFFYGNPAQRYTESELYDMVQHLCRGDCVDFDSDHLDPDMDMYVLGLAPNAARLSVRFFWHNTLGDMLRNVMAHYKRMEIVNNSKFQNVPVWMLLNETVVKSPGKSSEPAPHMAGDLMRAILMDAPYPASLYNGIENRIRADRDINRNRAGMIKAYYKYYLDHNMPVQGIKDFEEVLTVALNEDAKNTPYVLGRLFALLESIQIRATNANTTIKDRYFNAAQASPSHVFPVLVNLAQSHLHKIGGGLEVVMDKELGDLLDKIDQYPTHMTLAEQGVFQLGYYHEKEARFAKISEKAAAKKTAAANTVKTTEEEE